MPEPETWWYLSFVGETGFLGACIVQGAEMSDALVEAHRLKINPGGAVRGIKIPPDMDHGMPVNFLMSRADIELFSGTPAVSWKRDH